jgi:cell fate regulator YaaT (PSP1 superfamily)
MNDVHCGNGNTNTHEIIVTEVSVDDFIACIYENQWYVGKILDMDDQDVQVTFLEKAKAKFRPTSPDIIWCNKENVIYKLDSLEPSDKSERFWKINAEDIKYIEESFVALTNASQ